MAESEHSPLKAELYMCVYTHTHTNTHTHTHVYTYTHIQAKKVFSDWKALKLMYCMGFKLIQWCS